MNCPQCHFDCPPEFDFCPKCATRLLVTCPQCGFRAPADFAFCPKCGRAVLAGSAEAVQQRSTAALVQAAQRLMPSGLAERIRATQGQVSQERRLVTILFSDVKGSTALAEGLDPEEVMEIMSGAFDFLIQPIYRYEGTLARLMGDAILAFFGAPIAHEDDPERAICAGLEIVEGAQAYAAMLERERNLRGFNVRVGINTGLVVVGEVGSDLRVEYTAMGDAVNLASRLEQAAPEGSVLISHDTYRHVRGVFDVLPQEPLTVKGLREPVSTYLVRRLKPRAFRLGTRGVEGIETRMVGREAQLLTLQEAYGDAIEDAETHVVTIVGEAGVGKTRLMDEFLQWAELRPELFYYFKGRAASTAQTVPFFLWRDMLSFRFQILDSDGAATALQKFRAGMAGLLEPEKADLVGQLLGFDFSASPAVAALLGSPNFAVLARAYFMQYVRGLVAQRPLIMLLEDLQWADDSSLDLVAHLAFEVADAPVLIVGAARPTLLERRPNWGEGQEAYELLELKPLSKRSTRALVEEILQKVPDVPQTVRDMVVEGAEGNPYYVEELVKMLIEDGVIVPGEETWAVRPERLEQVRVPPTLTGILQARLDTLPREEKAVLQRASVVGRLFWDSALRELSAGAEERTDIEPLLESLREREMVFRRELSAFADCTEYTFKHSILRDVTYETVLLRARRRYHALVAAWLEAHAGERLGEYLELIASHCELAGDNEKAAEYLRRSGEEAMQVSAYRDAQSAFERALRLLPPEAQRQRAALLFWQGVAEGVPGDHSSAAWKSRAALEAARASGDRVIEANALVGLGVVSWRQGDHGSARDYLSRGHSLAQSCGDIRGQALGAQHLARVSWLTGRFDDAARFAKESHALYAQVGDRQGVIAALNELGITSTFQDRFDEAIRLYSSNLTQAREMGDRGAEAQALNNLGEVARQQGDYERALDCYQQALAINEEIGNRWGTCIMRVNLGMVSVHLGHEGEAWVYTRRLLQDAWSLRSFPEVLGGVGCVAMLQSRAGHCQRAAELIGLVLRHPASTSEAAETAEPFLADLRQRLSPEELEAAMARGAQLDLEAVVAEILQTP
jgi:class 3 adenylate cyclase/tetratricopeptide (TPR) repeat protein